MTASEEAAARIRRVRRSVHRIHRAVTSLLPARITAEDPEDFNAKHK